MNDNDLKIALLLERQILKEKYPLTCGCVLQAPYAHSAHQEWLWVEKYITVCEHHKKLAAYLSEERRSWASGGHVPGWRHAGDGERITRGEWHQVTMNPDVPRMRRGVFRYSGEFFLLLLNYMGMPLTKATEQAPKHRATCLNLTTGWIVDRDVPEALLRRFGWQQEKG